MTHVIKCNYMYVKVKGASYDRALLRNLITYMSACITSSGNETYHIRSCRESSSQRQTLTPLSMLFMNCLPPCTCGCLISMLNNQQASSTVSGLVLACVRSRILRLVVRKLEPMGFDY